MQKPKIQFYHPKLIPKSKPNPDPNAASVLNRGGVVIGMKKENGKERIYPDEEEIAIIEQYTDELDEEYGIDPIQSDSFSFEYEAEQEC